MNYDSGFRSYDCVFHDKIVLFVQLKLQESQYIVHKQCFFSVVHKFLCNRPKILVETTNDSVAKGYEYKN